MARTRWPPDWEPRPLVQARQNRDGTAGGCQRNLGTPADRSFRKTTSGVSRLAGQAGTPGHRPYARTRPSPRKQGRKHTHILPADYEWWPFGLVTVTLRA